MPRHQDADRLLARGSSRGTAPGRAVRLESPRPRTPRAAPDQTPTEAEVLLRPRRWPLSVTLAWIGIAAVVGVIYISITHALPWFLILVIAGRILVGRFVSHGDWIALVGDELQIRKGGADVWSVPRRDVASIHVGRQGASRVEFLDHLQRPLASAPVIYTTSQIDELATALGVAAITPDGRS